MKLSASRNEPNLKVLAKASRSKTQPGSSTQAVLISSGVSGLLMPDDAPHFQPGQMDLAPGAWRLVNARTAAQGHLSLNARTLRKRSATRRDHHGWQRPLGQAARPAPHRGAPAGSGDGADDHVCRARPWDPDAHALCVFDRELETPAG